MASIRQLKKDIDYLVASVIEDCMHYSHLSKNGGGDQVNAIILDVVSCRNEALDKINGAGKFATAKESGKFYGEVVKEVFVRVDKAFTELCAIVKK